MKNQGLTIAQAARTTGLSARTIRRYIKSGRISAQVIPGGHGKEFRIATIPEELTRQRTIDKQPGQTIDIIGELLDKNLQLAVQLGVATERIRTLESQVKLLTKGEQMDRMLSPGELQLLKLLGQAKSNKQIAAELGTAEQTVKNQLQLVYLKLGVYNRTGAVIKAIELEL